MSHNLTYLEIIDRYVKGTPVADMRRDLARTFDGMLRDGYDTDQLKKMLNQACLPTVSGKARWTVGEIRGLIR